jgi:ubiquitin carboxyl-terminal hydrolase 10
MGVTASVELPASMQNSIEPEDESEIASSSGPVTLDTPKIKTASPVASTVDLSPEASSGPAKIKTASSVASTVDLSPEASSIHGPPEQEHAQSSSSTSVSAKAVLSPVASTPTKASKPVARTAIPAVPVIPVVPKTSPKETKSLSSSEDSQVITPCSSVLADDEISQPSNSVVADDEVAQAALETVQAGPEIALTPIKPTKAAPKLWSSWFKNATPATTPSTGLDNSEPTATLRRASSSDTTNVGNGLSGPGSFAKSNTNSLAEALRVYQVSNSQKLAFLQPRCLINTGNMCYMNSVSST